MVQEEYHSRKVLFSDTSRSLALFILSTKDSYSLATYPHWNWCVTDACCLEKIDPLVQGVLIEVGGALFSLDIVEFIVAGDDEL